MTALKISSERAREACGVVIDAGDGLGLGGRRPHRGTPAGVAGASRAGAPVMSERFRLGVDIGGTFTDAVLLSEASGATPDREGPPRRPRTRRGDSSPRWSASWAMPISRRTLSPTWCTALPSPPTRSSRARRRAPRSSPPRASATCWRSAGRCGRRSTTSTSRSRGRWCRATSASRSRSGSMRAAACWSLWTRPRSTRSRGRWPSATSSRSRSACSTAT